MHLWPPDGEVSSSQHMGLSGAIEIHRSLPYQNGGPKTIKENRRNNRERRSRRDCGRRTTSRRRSFDASVFGVVEISGRRNDRTAPEINTRADQQTNNQTERNALL